MLLRSVGAAYLNGGPATFKRCLNLKVLEDHMSNHNMAMTPGHVPGMVRTERFGALGLRDIEF